MASITVNATGSVPVTEHRAEVHLHVEVGAEAPGDALAGLDQRLQRLRGVLAGQAVGDDDVATHGLHVQPRFDPEAGRERGATAGSTVVVGLAGLEAVPDLVAAVVAEGVSVQQVVQVPVVTPDMEATARRLAVEQARELAGQLAAASGGAIGGLLSLLEPGGGLHAYAPNTGIAYPHRTHVWEQHGRASVTVTAVYELVDPADR